MALTCIRGTAASQTGTVVRRGGLNECGCLSFRISHYVDLIIPFDVRITMLSVMHTQFVCDVTGAIYARYGYI